MSGESRIRGEKETFEIDWNSDSRLLLRRLCFDYIEIEHAWWQCDKSRVHDAAAIVSRTLFLTVCFPLTHHIYELSYKVSRPFKSQHLMSWKVFSMFLFRLWLCLNFFPFINFKKWISKDERRRMKERISITLCTVDCDRRCSNFHGIREILHASHFQPAPLQFSP